MITVALWLTLTAVAQPQIPPPVTVEVLKDVEVTRPTREGEQKGKLYLDDATTKPFRFRKGDRFVMIAIGQEGGCRVRFRGKEFGFSSCPWTEGFADHQSDVFRVITK